MASKVTQFRSVAPALVEQRNNDRHVVELKRASVRRHGAKAVEGQLYDISVYGCRVRSDVDARTGERLWLRFPGGLPIAATVVWHDRGFTGCRFDSPIDRALVRNLGLPTY